MTAFEKLQQVKEMIKQLVVCWTIILNLFQYDTIDLSKQQALDVDRKAIQKINFTGNLDWAADETMFFIIEEAKETISDISQGTAKVL